LDCFSLVGEQLELLQSQGIGIVKNQEEINFCIKEFKNYDLVILAPLSCLSYLDETHRNVTTLFSVLERIAIQANVAILVLHYISQDIDMMANCVMTLSVHTKNKMEQKK